MRFITLLSFTLAVLPYYAYSYCVYNKHSDDTMLLARQYKWNGHKGGWSAFRQDISAGDKACCPYTVQSCNQNLDQNNIVKLWIERHAPFAPGVSHFSVTLPAGGWVVVDGDLWHHTVAVRWADGRPYEETEIVYNARWYANLNATRTANLEEHHRSQNMTQNQSQNATQPQFQSKVETH